MMLAFSLNNRGFLISFINLVLWSLKFAELLPVALLSPGWEEAELCLRNLGRAKFQGVKKAAAKSVTFSRTKKLLQNRSSKGLSDIRAPEVPFDKSGGGQLVFSYPFTSDCF